MTSQTLPIHSYDSSLSAPSQSHSEYGADDISERLRESAFAQRPSRAPSAVGDVSAKLAPATTMSDVHEFSFNQIAAGPNAFETAQNQAFSKMSADIGDAFPKPGSSGEISFLDALTDGKNSPAANDDIWSAVCESVFKQSVRPLTVMRKRQEASEAAALKCVGEGETHHPPKSSQAENRAFAVIAQADQAYGTSRAKFASLKVGTGDDAQVLSGAVHTNSKGSFFKTPQATYQMKFDGDRLALQNGDGQLFQSELLGRHRPKVQETPKDSPASRQHYVVQSGETSNSIASKLFNNNGYGRLVEQINKLPPDSELLAGMKLQLPNTSDLAAYAST